MFLKRMAITTWAVAAIFIGNVSATEMIKKMEVDCFNGVAEAVSRGGLRVLDIPSKDAPKAFNDFVEERIKKEPIIAAMRENPARLPSRPLQTKRYISSKFEELVIREQFACFFPYIQNNTTIRKLYLDGIMTREQTESGLVSCLLGKTLEVLALNCYRTPQESGPTYDGVLAPLLASMKDERLHVKTLRVMTGYVSPSDAEMFVTMVPQTPDLTLEIYTHLVQSQSSLPLLQGTASIKVLDANSEEGLNFDH